MSLRGDPLVKAAPLSVLQLDEGSSSALVLKFPLDLAPQDFSRSGGISYLRIRARKVQVEAVEVEDLLDPVP